MKKLAGVLSVLALVALPIGLVSELLQSVGLRPLGAPFGAPSPDDIGRLGARERYRAALSADASVAAAARDARSRHAETVLAAPLPLALPYAERLALDGRRAHHGIDIFAPRGTPVLAAADGVVVRVGALYYAHLDSVEVLAGTRLSRGERLGTVGNTGNARTAPPHLHFGLYRRPFGPMDPLPLVGERRVAPLEPAAGHALAAWRAVRSPALNLRSGPGTRHAVVARIDGGTLVRVLGGSDRWARVRATAADGTRATGFVARALLGLPDGVPERLDATAELSASPERGAPLLATLEPGETVDVSGVFDGYRRVESAGGLSGWLRPDPPDGGEDAALPDG